MLQTKVGSHMMEVDQSVDSQALDNSHNCDTCKLSQAGGAYMESDVLEAGPK